MRASFDVTDSRTEALIPPSGAFSHRVATGEGDNHWVPASENPWLQAMGNWRKMFGL